MSQDETPIDDFNPTVTLTFGGKDHPSRREINMEMSLDNFWKVCETIQEIGLDRTAHLLNFASFLSTLLIEERVPNPTEAFSSIWRTLAKLVTNQGQPWKDDRDRVLAFSYALLRRKWITRAQAAAWASKELGETISTDAWRKRVDRWAEEHGYPKVEQRRRTPKRTK